MTPPADLGDLRALVEAVNNEHAYMLGPGWLRDCGCTICRAFPAARETLERLEENAAKAQEHRDTGPRCQPNPKARLTRLAEALVRYGRHASGCPEDLTGTVVLKSEFRQRPCSCGFTAALAGRDE